MDIVWVQVAVGSFLLFYFHRSFTMSAASDRLAAAVQANTVAVQALVAAFQGVPGEGVLNALADQVEANTAAAVAAVTPPPTP